MASAPNIDGVLIQWGDRLFYPGNRMVKGRPEPRLRAGSDLQRAAAIRARIAATVVRRAPQVMVKVTGGGRGMKAIAAHFRYISKNGRLDIEDERGEVQHGKDALQALADDWRFGGTPIDDVGDRREAFNIMLSMPRGVDPLIVQRAAREFAQAELADHKFVMVLHDHQANPHVHISVRAESMRGKRLNPRKADLHRWREIFAEKLQGWGVQAEATRQATRGRSQNYEPLWRIKAREDGRLRSTSKPGSKISPKARLTRAQAAEAWRQVAQALAMSTDQADRELARSIDGFIQDQSASTRDMAPRVGADLRQRPAPTDVALRR
jgi:type IV secretory pathway VirD2 relaxase